MGSTMRTVSRRGEHPNIALYKAGLSHPNKQTEEATKPPRGTGEDFGPADRIYNKYKNVLIEYVYTLYIYIYIYIQTCPY